MSVPIMRAFKRPADSQMDYYNRTKIIKIAYEDTVAISNTAEFLKVRRMECFDVVRLIVVKVCHDKSKRCGRSCNIEDKRTR